MGVTPIATLRFPDGATARINELYVATTYTGLFTSTVNESTNRMEVMSVEAQAERIWPSFPFHVILPGHRTQPGAEPLPKYAMLLLLQVSEQATESAVNHFLVVAVFQDILSPLIDPTVVEAIQNLPWRERASPRPNSL